MAAWMHPEATSKGKKKQTESVQAAANGRLTLCQFWRAPLPQAHCQAGMPCAQQATQNCLLPCPSSWRCDACRASGAATISQEGPVSCAARSLGVPPCPAACVKMKTKGLGSCLCLVFRKGPANLARHYRVGPTWQGTIVWDTKPNQIACSSIC